MQSILTAAADSRGEWHLPLTVESLEGMEAVMDANAEHVNEALVSYAYAWMRKAHDDKIPGALFLQPIFEALRFLTFHIDEIHVRFGESEQAFEMLALGAAP